MFRRMNIFLLFLVLSVTPFIRGCGESFGFPFPALVNIAVDGSIRATLEALVKSLATPPAAMLLLADIFIGIVLALMAQRSVRGRLFLGALLGVLAVHLALIWAMVGIYIGYPKPYHPIASQVIELYAKGFFAYFYAVPDAVANFFSAFFPSKATASSPLACVVTSGPENPAAMALIDTVSRLWFVFVTFVMGALVAAFASAVSGSKKSDYGDGGR